MSLGAFLDDEYSKEPLSHRKWWTLFSLLCAFYYFLLHFSLDRKNVPPPRPSDRQELVVEEAEEVLSSFSAPSLTAKSVAVAGLKVVDSDDSGRVGHKDSAHGVVPPTGKNTRFPHDTHVVVVSDRPHAAKNFWQIYVREIFSRFSDEDIHSFFR